MDSALGKSFTTRQILPLSEEEEEEVFACFSSSSLHKPQKVGRSEGEADYTVKATRVAENLFLLSRTSH